MSQKNVKDLSILELKGEIFDRQQELERLNREVNILFSVLKEKLNPQKVLQEEIEIKERIPEVDEVDEVDEVEVDAKEELTQYNLES